MDYSGLYLILAAGFLGLFVLAGWAMQQLEHRRSKRVRDTARTLGLEVKTQPDPELCQCLEGCMLLGSGHSARLWNLMQGKVGVHDVALFDFRYVTGSGKGSKTWTQTVLRLRFDGRSLPQFALRPETETMMEQ